MKTTTTRTHVFQSKLTGMYAIILRFSTHIGYRYEIEETPDIYCATATKSIYEYDYGTRSALREDYTPVEVEITTQRTIRKV